MIDREPADEPRTLEPAPGLRLERRAVIAAPAGLVAALLFARSARAAARPEPPLDFEAFARRCEELAAELAADQRPNPDAYLFGLSALAARLVPDSVPRPELGRFGALEPAVHFGPVHRAAPVVIIQWRLDAGAVLPPHNHTPAHVLSVCLEGECSLRHFDVEGEAPAPGAEGAFGVRETARALLRPGRMTSLTPQRDNIHTFAAGPEGALGIDVNTFLPGEGDWSYLALGDQPIDPERRVWAARWIGKRL